MSSQQDAPEDRRARAKRARQQPPATPAGKRVQDRRLLLGLTVEQAAEEAGLTRAKWGAVERGRMGNHDGLYHGPDGYLARMAAALGITPEELEEDGREGAAKMLRAGIPKLSLVPSSGKDWQKVLSNAARLALAGKETEAGKLAEEYIASAPMPDTDRRVLMWRYFDGRDEEMNLLPFARRFGDVLDWVSNHMGGQGEADIKIIRPTEAQ